MAACPHTLSQRTSQQNWSIAQTDSQQTRSLQYGVSFWWQQLPARGLPQEKQKRFAQSTQVESQAVSQQFGSMLQTRSQQVVSLQFGFSCSARHDPVAGSPQVSVSLIASSTQFWSHDTEQQYSRPGTSHTAWQITPLLHDGVGCATKQLSGTAPQLEQNFCARATQTSSHAMSQQAGSMVQTSPQQSGLLQPGARRFGVKQVLVAVEHDACASARPARRTSAAASRAERIAMGLGSRMRARDLKVGRNSGRSERIGRWGALRLVPGQGVVSRRALPELRPVMSLNGAPISEKPRVDAAE